MRGLVVIILVALGWLNPKALLGQEQARAQAKVGELSPSDLAILFPLKPSAEPDALFPVEGDGYCNAPALADEQQPLLSLKDFNFLIDQIFGVQAAIEPPAYLAVPDAELPEDLRERKRHYGAWSDLSAAAEQRQAQLAAVQSAYDHTDYPAPLFCHQPHLAGDIADLGDDYQLELGHHLVQSEGVLHRACDYDAWRVVALRFNPCLEQAEIPGFWQHDALPAACRTREFRLVLQPVYREGDRLVVADLAMHFIYRLPLSGMNELIAGLKGIRRLQPQSKAEPLTLAPHPGLMAEMNRCDGAVAGGIKALVAKAAQREWLSSVAWMSSSASQSRWSFGSFPAASIGKSLPDSSSLTASISLREMSQRVDRFPFTKALMAEHEVTVAPVYEKPFRNPGEPITDPVQLAEARRIFAQLDKLDNPLLISQVADDPHSFSSDCVSCHTVSQSRKRLAAAVAIDDVSAQAEPSYRNRKGQKAVPWPLLPKRRSSNFRNFGYGPGSSDRFLPAIAPRVSHEALNIVDVLETFF